MAAKPIILDDAQRELFFAYCLQEMKTNKTMATQMEKLPHGVVLARRQKTMAAAYAVVADDLNPANWERMTVGGKE